VRGLSNRPPEAARLGYRTRAQRQAPRRVASPPPRPRTDDPDHPWAVADRLLESLLDDEQRASRRRWGHWWVRTDRGWLQMGRSPHDIRFRPDAEPGREHSLCVVAADRSLPPGDVWSTLLLTATATPETFFRVANVSPPPTPTPAPVDPPA
jgi:hypothetical protein